ncbi:MAG: putative ABC transporter permease [Bacilli bacterium]|nr:putative ABC transporter permease [Bacilli bacterium]
MTLFDLKIYFLLFIIYSFAGWIIDTSDVFIEEKKLVKRGFLFAPLCPVYGTCSVLMILVLNKIQNPWLLYLLCVILCSVTEYFTGYIMEKVFKARWWNYSHNKFNLHGRICLRNCLLFGLGGFLLIKIINPQIVGIITKIDPTIIDVCFYILLITFILDVATSTKLISNLKKQSYISNNEDNTDTIVAQKNKQVKKNYKKYKEKITKSNKEK